MADIFISYSSDDRARARTFADAFEAEGLSVWWDAGLRAGDAYDQKIEQALRSAKAVVVIWSKTSVESRWVRAEATLADRARTLVPCMIETCDRPIMFELTHTVELAHWQGDPADKAWQVFLGDVKRFVAKERTASAALPALAAVAAHAGPAPETLLAVLAFDNLSSDAEMQYFSDGVSEDILGRIQRGSKLKVIGRTSSFQFRGADKAKAAAALKATHVLDGSIRRGGAKVRIAASLTDVASQTTLWSDKYDRGLDDVFAVQDEISEAIATALDTAFFPPRQTAIDPDAYDLYLRSRVYSGNPNLQLQNIATLERVTQMAPAFADGWVSLASARQALSYYLPYAERPAINAQIRAALGRGLELDADNANAGWVEWYLCDPFGAFLAQELAAQKMIDKGHGSAMSQSILAWHLETVGRNREAALAAQRAYDLDPQNWVASALRCQTLWRAGQFVEGLIAVTRHCEIWPDDHHTAATRILALIHQKDWDQLTDLLGPDHLAKYPLREHDGVRRLAEIARSPDAASSRAMVEFAVQNTGTLGGIEPTNLIFAPQFGLEDEIFDLVDRLKFGPNGGQSDIMGINAYRSNMLFAADYPALRNDQRFVKLCARLGLVEYWLATQKWPDCADTVPYDFRAECEAYRDYSKDKFFA